MLIVVIFFFVLILSVGVVVSKRAKKASDFLVAGRKVNLLLTTATLAAMQIRRLELPFCFHKPIRPRLSLT